MTQDDLLSRLGRLARVDAEGRDEALDGRWDALARGELSTEEQEALRRENPEAYEAFSPLDEDFRADLADRLHPPENEEEGAKVLPFSRRGRLLLRWAATAAAAAALAVSMLLPGGAVPRPDYVLVVEGGALTLRSEASEPTAPTAPNAETSRVLRPGDRLEVLLRPETDVDGPVEARASLVPADPSRASRNVTPRLEVAETGAVRLAGVLGEELDWPPGSWTLRIAVGRLGETPKLWEVSLRIEP